MIKTSYQTCNYTARKSALKLANLPSFLKGDTLRVSEDIAPKKGKSQNFTDVLMVGDTNLTPTIQTYVKYGDFAELLYIVVSFQQITFKLGIFTNFKAFLLTVLTNFC